MLIGGRLGIGIAGNVLRSVWCRAIDLQPSLVDASTRAIITLPRQRHILETSMASPLANVLVVGCGGVGTLMAYALEKGGRASVTAVLRSNFAVVAEKGFDIDSVNHGQIEGWRPQNSTTISPLPSLSQPHHRCSFRAARPRPSY